MNTHKAYAHGVLDSYNCGEYNNPYGGHEKPEEHLAYKQGYDYGLFLYIQNQGE